jgi:phage terminase small subunit
MKPRNFTSEQSGFIDDFMVDMNATQAAIRAGYSPRSAHVIAQKTLQNPAVQAELQARRAAETERLDVTRQQLEAGLL